MSSGKFSVDTIVFVGGKAKALGDCTAEDLDQFAADLEHQAEQLRAWSEWFAETAQT